MSPSEGAFGAHRCAAGALVCHTPSSSPPFRVLSALFLHSFASFDFVDLASSFWPEVGLCSPLAL